MKTRQKILLEILNNFTNPPTKTHLVKLLFLLGQETEINSQISFYDFLPYRFGPFSFTVYGDLEMLERYGLLYPDSLKIVYGQKQTILDWTSTLPQSVTKSTTKILREYGNISLDRLVQKVYGKYPWYASRSQRIPHPAKEHPSPAVYTIGYEGKSIDAFLNDLLFRGIERIVDVRSNPLSRKFGFSKSMLCNLANKVDIDYVHFPELGIPSEDRKRLVTQGDYGSLFAVYENTILPKQKSVLQQAATLFGTKPSVLMCFENDAKYCHRGRLAKHLTRISALPSIHL